MKGKERFESVPSDFPQTEKQNQSLRVLPKIKNSLRILLRHKIPCLMNLDFCMETPKTSPLIAESTTANPTSPTVKNWARND
jgi:hypothetical protein